MLLYTSLFSILILKCALSCSLVSQSPPIVLGFTGHPASVQLGEQARAFEYYVWGAGGAGMIAVEDPLSGNKARKGGDGDFASGTVWISESRSAQYYTTSIDVFVGEGGWNKFTNDTEIKYHSPWPDGGIVISGDIYSTGVVYAPCLYSSYKRQPGSGGASTSVYFQRTETKTYSVVRVGGGGAGGWLSDVDAGYNIGMEDGGYTTEYNDRSLEPGGLPQDRGQPGTHCQKGGGGGPFGGAGVYSTGKTSMAQGGRTNISPLFQSGGGSHAAQLSEGEILDVLGLPRPGLGGAPQQEGVDPWRHGLAVFRLMVCEGAGTTVEATTAETTVQAQGAGTTVQATAAETTQFEATTAEGAGTTAEGAGTTVQATAAETTVQATPMPAETTAEATPMPAETTQGETTQTGGYLLTAASSATASSATTTPAPVGPLDIFDQQSTARRRTAPGGGWVLFLLVIVSTRCLGNKTN